MNVKPTFLFIGPDKSGSSWLYEVLRQHPACYVPACKDIYFFDRYYDQGIDWYLSFFKDAPLQVQAVGELSHDYLFSPLAADRIKKHLPGVKLLTTLRHPVERSFSHYLYLVRSGITRKPFRKALEKFPELISQSMYDIHLSEYLRRFDPSQIKILYFDDLKSDPEAFAGNVFKFLGLSSEKTIQYSKRVRPASRPRSYFLARIGKFGATASRELGFPQLVGVVKNSRLTQLLYAPYSQKDRPQMDPAIREELSDLFEPSISRLENMFEVNLSHWLSNKQGGGR